LLLYGKKTMTPTAHIQTALEAACKFGRKQYDHANHDCSRALLALAEMNQPRTPRREQTAATAATTPVVGGGNSLSGKILWLLENNGPLTRREIGDRLQLSGIRECVYKLTKQGRVTVHGRGNSARVTFVSREVVA
jgi:hypothetical protein